MAESFSSLKTKVLLQFYVFETASMILSNLDKAVLSNHLHVQCFDSAGSFAALRRLLLNSIFQV